MALKVYHASPTRSVRVVWALEELGLPYELQPVKLDFTYLKSPEWRVVSPTGKVPAVVEDDKTLVESVAITHYLAEKYGEGKLARRPVDPDYADFLQWMHYGEAGMGGYAGMLVAQTRLLPAEQRLEVMKQWAIGECRNACDYVESSLEGKDYILGEDFSLADISLGYILYLISLSGEGDKIFSARTKLYLNRLTEREAWKKATS